MVAILQKLAKDLDAGTSFKTFPALNSAGEMVKVAAASLIAFGLGVAPEQFGTIGVSAAQDTAAIQAAINTALPVYLSAVEYKVNAELTPANGVPLVIKGVSSKIGGTLITMQAGFTGFMIKPSGGYDIQGLRIAGNGSDGAHAIGNDASSGSGLARLCDLYINNIEVGVYFGGNWQHPIGLLYDNVYVQGFRSGGICIGGTAGVTQGESAWNFTNCVLSNNGQSGIAAAGLSVTNSSPDATHDAVSWTGTAPMFGWLVMRSANGTTGWHVPPNWNSALFTGNSFSALKGNGETWNYIVVRQTRAGSLRNGKAVFFNACQVEYAGIGLLLDTIQGFDVGPLYDEQRDPTGGATPRPNFAMAVAVNSYGNFAGGRVEAKSYGYAALSNAQIKVGRGLANNCQIAAFMEDGSTLQFIQSDNFKAAGTTPAFRANPSSGVNNNGYAVLDFTTGVTSYTLDAASGVKFSANFRNVLKAELGADSTGEGYVSTQRLAVTLPSKTLKPQNTNKVFNTNLSSGVATAFMTVDLGAAAVNGMLEFNYHVQVTDSFSARQATSGKVIVALINTAGTARAKFIDLSVTDAQLGTLTPASPAFTFTASGNVLTFYYNTTVAGVTPTAFRIYCSEVTCLLGNFTPVITQL